MSSSDPLVRRVARVRRVDHRGEALLRRQVDGDRDDLGPRDHHLVHLLAREVEDLVQHLLLRLLEHACVLGLADGVEDVLARVAVDAGRRGLDAEQA